MAKNRFYIYTEYLNYLEGMSDSDQALLFRTMLKYENGDELEELTPVVKAVWGFIKARMDNLDKKYQETCEARSKAGSKGGEAKANKRKQKVVNASKCQQELANVANNDNDNDNDKKEKEKYKKEKAVKHVYGEYKHVKLTDDEYSRLIEEYGEDAVLDGIKNVDEYCQTKGKTYKDYNLVMRNWGIKSPKLEPSIKPPNIPDKYADYEKVTFDDD